VTHVACGFILATNYNTLEKSSTNSAVNMQKNRLWFALLALLINSQTAKLFE